MHPNAPHILHIFSTFAPGGPQVRLTRILNVLGSGWRTSIMAMDGNTEAVERISGAPITLLAAPRKANGLAPSLEIASVLRQVRPDLVVTYNWGAIDAVLGIKISAVCPLIHAEDGFGPDEAVALKHRRVFARRLLLRGAYKTVVPSRRLETIALQQYRLKPEKVEYIPNGVDTAHFAPGPAPEYRQRRDLSADCLLFGFVGQLRQEKNLTLLLRAFAAVAEPHWKLAIVGEGPCRAELEQLTRDLGIDKQVLFEGATEDTASYLRAFDVFVMSSVTEQMPIALLEAMAAGLPAIVTDAGDSRQMLSGGLHEIVPPGDAAAYGKSLKAIARDANLRREIGAKNRARCIAEYSEPVMIQRYAQLYEDGIRSKECAFRPPVVPAVAERQLSNPPSVGER